jgi:hypothetical protein
MLFCNQDEGQARRNKMKASDIKLKELKTDHDHDVAIDQIEFDPTNIVGGHKAWASGNQTFMTTAAEKKIAAIRKQQYKLFPCDED